MIFPQANGPELLDVGTTASLKHDGGGDTQAVAQMVKYALKKYNGDPNRVYAMGGSSGGMMTQALMAVYPDVFRAARRGRVFRPDAGRTATTPAMQWSNNCAGGNTTKTAQQWGDLVRGCIRATPDTDPRLQSSRRQSDTTINYKNTAESIKEWTNVLGLRTADLDRHVQGRTPTASSGRTRVALRFEAWSSHGGHSMPYESDAILKFFGLDKAGGPIRDRLFRGGAAAPVARVEHGRRRAGGPEMAAAAEALRAAAA